MKSGRSLWCSAVMALLSLAVLDPAVTLAQSTAPAYLPIQGYLTDADDTPLDGKMTITFSLYNDKVASDESRIYQEVISVVNVTAGHFTVYLGEKTPLDLNLFRQHRIVFVGILVSGDDAELEPLLQLATAPYAAFAQNAGVCGDASTLEGKASSAFMPSSYLPSWSSISGRPTEFTPAAHQHAWSDISNPPSYTAGTGLSLAGTQFSVDPAVIQQKLGTDCGPGLYAYGVESATGALKCRADANSGGAIGSVVASSSGGVTATTSGSQVTVGMTSACSNNQVLRWNTSTSRWECRDDSITQGNGITVTNGTGAATVSVNPAQIVGAAASASGSSWTTSLDTSGSVATITSVNLTSPAAGKVMVMGSATCFSPSASASTSCGLNVSVTDGTTSFNGYEELSVGEKTFQGMSVEQVSTSGVFAVTAGTKTFSLRASMSSGCSGQCGFGTLSTIFVAN